MRKNKRKQPVAVYVVATTPFRLILSIPIPFFLLWIVIIGNTALQELRSGNWFGGCFVGLSIFFFVFAIWMTFQMVCISGSRLLLFDTGIEIHLPCEKSFVHWDELCQFGWKQYGRFYHWGILVNEPMTKSESFCSKIFMRRYTLLDDFIPLHYWENGLRNSNRPVDLERFKKTPLGSDLYYYAPHLFTEMDTDKPKH